MSSTHRMHPDDEPHTMKSVHPNSASPRLPRRSFLGWVLAAGGALGVPLGSLAALPLPKQYPAVPDEGWLRGLVGKHRQVFDAPSVQSGKVLMQVRNFLDAYRDAYGLTDGELSAAIVVHGTAMPLVFGDAIWARFDFGERFGIRDAQARTPARRNVFANVRAGDPVPAEASVEGLQRRGVVIVLCNNTLKRVTADLAASLSRPAHAVREELLAGLLPGVTVVPAAVVALNRAQEHGLSYVYSG